MKKIQILPQEVIDLIAAGEVVERPASVIKELVENSIDAGAKKVIVEIEDFGRKLIKVSDNGHGMDQTDAELALKQHATSKIKDMDDLETIQTFGFRGEALASIAAVSETTILETKTQGSEPVKIELKKQKTRNTSSFQTENGTIVEIHNLFGNIPARKKFLKSENTELKHINETFISIALTNPEIHFELNHNNKTLHRLTSTSNLKNRVFEIFGKEIANNLYESTVFDNGNHKIFALLGNSKIAKKTVSHQYVFVNNRWVSDRLISTAIANAYRGFIHKDLKPIYFLFIHMNGDQVDVNVHPRKLEIRFQNPKEVFGLVFNLVKKTLEKSTKSFIDNNLKRFDNRVEEKKFFVNEPSQPYQGTKAAKHKNSSTESKISPKAIKNNSAKSATTRQALRFTEHLFSSVDSSDNQDLTSYDHAEEIHNNVMQVFNTYILVEKEDKVLIVDQHAAAEKILFEKLTKTIGKVSKKPLLIPEVIELKPQEKKELLNLKEEIEKIGLTIDDFGGNSIQISEIPELIDKLNIEEFLQEILNEPDIFSKTYQDFRKDNDQISQKIYSMVATTACHGSIRAGQKLELVEMKQLLKDLLALENPYNCPHGRPVMWELERYEIEKNFKRVI